MPSNAAGRRAVLNIENSDGHITLIVLSHPDITTQRLAMSRNDVVVSAGGGGSPHDGTYTGYPFEVELPTDDKGVPRGTIRISHVTSLIWNLIGNVQAPPPQVNIYRVLESDVNTIQDRFLLLDLQRISATILTVEGVIGHENFAVEPCPAARVIPPIAPWMTLLG